MSDDLGSIIKADPKYVQFRAITIEVRSTLELEKDMEEAIRLHTSRPSRNLIGNPLRFSRKHLMECVFTEMSYRNRMVRLRGKVLQKTAALDQAVRAFQGYAATQYVERFRDYGTAEQRRHLLDRLVGPALDVLTDADAHLAILAEFIQDIDQANWHMQRIVDMMKLHNEAKGMRNV